ncbi:MAG: hypothetical protein JO031_17460 [Ktedonobacteraceae bacterium]|nr:hypothetical protein [Ktedonobacteraceae bacterium]
MTLEEVNNAFKQQVACEFYSSGKGWVAWLDEGWHEGIIVAVDETLPGVVLHISSTHSAGYTIIVEVRGEKDILDLLRLLE